MISANLGRGCPRSVRDGETGLVVALAPPPRSACSGYAVALAPPRTDGRAWSGSAATCTRRVLASATDRAHCLALRIGEAMNATELSRRVVRNRLMRAAIRSRLPVIQRPDLVRLGSAGCGWWVPEGLIAPGGIAYCAGVGQDITFDLALIERFGCHVWAFDPTPSVVDAVRSWVIPPQWHFEPVGIWNCGDSNPLLLPEASRPRVAFGDQCTGHPQIRRGAGREHRHAHGPTRARPH